MAYQALYRTYRPQTFDEVVGQKAIVTTLQNALSRGKISHAYLFCGPRGTGKTTMARLFAKALNCQDGIGHQCNKCDSCLAITKGDHPDVYEIDAASNSGVDNVRRLIEEVSFAPIMGRYKVYIIDEIHSMSSSAFNALLKTIEEPPEHVVFIMATTEPNKVLPTILSRVQRYDFSKVSDDDLIVLMKRVLEKEGVEYEDRALDVIARLSDGGCRDALSNLEQAVSYAKDKLTLDDVYSMFGLFRIDEEIELVKMIHQKDLKGALEFASSRFNKGADIVRLHDDLIDIYKDLLIYGTTEEASFLTYLKPEEAYHIPISPQEIRKNLKVLIEHRREYRTSFKTFSNFELTLIELSLNLDDQAQIQVSKPVEVKQEVKQETPITEVKVETPPAPKEDVIIEEKIEVQPLNKKEVEPAPIQKTITGDMVYSSGNDQPCIDIDEDFVINIMVQGDKEKRKSLQAVWKERLDLISPDSSTLFNIANILSKSTICVLAKNVLIVSSVFEGNINKLNSKDGLKASEEIMGKFFSMPGTHVVGVLHQNYVNYVKAFMEMYQAGTLPEAREIELHIKQENSQTQKKEKTQAELWADMINGK